MPNVWLTRFGRTASDQTVQAILHRVEGGPREAHLTVGGIRLDNLWKNARHPVSPKSIAGAPNAAPASLLRMPVDAEDRARENSGATGWIGLADFAAPGSYGSILGYNTGPAMPQSLRESLSLGPPGAMVRPLKQAQLLKHPNQLLGASITRPQIVSVYPTSATCCSVPRSFTARPPTAIPVSRICSRPVARQQQPASAVPRGL